jgi:glycosyltransferase involved in cell wall biosynthesis
VKVSKALFVSPAAAAYGSERSMLALLRARQFQAEVACPVGGALERELAALGIKVHPLEFNKFALRQNPLWHVGFFRRFRRILEASQPDVVVINLDGNTPLVTLASVRAGIPIVRFCRFEFKPPTRWIDRWCWLRAKAIICPSEMVKQQVLAWAPPELHPRVHRLYDSYAGRVAAPQETAAFRQKFGLGDDKIVGCVGRLDRGKRIEIAVKALAEARKQVGNARLMVIGGDGSPDETAYKEELQQIAAELGVREAVTFTGYCQAEDMPAAIASFNVCVLPSESESFGMVLMEAWAEGVPTIASNIGGCREITLASGGGRLAPVGKVEIFAGHLLELLLNPQLAENLGQKGRTWVDQNCAPAEYAAKFESIINACKSAAP